MTPRLSALRALRPATLAALTAATLLVLLTGGYAVARAMDGTPTASTAPAADSSSATGTVTTSPDAGGGTTGGTNAAVAAGTQDGRTVYAIRLKLVQTANDTVDATNAAVAVNSGCTGCTTVAIAFEGVVVIGSPSTFDPTNLALAANIDCSGCTAFADAYQQVVQTSTRVRVTPEGRREIARIRKDLNDLRHSGLGLEEIRARVAADEQAFAEVLRTQLVPVGHETTAPDEGADISDSPEATPAASPSGASASTSASPSTPASDGASTSPGSASPSTSGTTSTPTASPSAAAAGPSPSASVSPTPRATPSP